MNSRYFSIALLCAGIGLPVVRLKSQPIDLRPRTPQLPARVQPTPLPDLQPAPNAPIIDAATQDRILRRRAQYHERRAAMQHVKRLRKFTLIDPRGITRAYDAKRQALARFAKPDQPLPHKLAAAKNNVLDEVKNLAQSVRRRFEAEERALATALRQMREDDPSFAEKSLRNAVAAAEQRPAEPVKDTEKLPILSKTVDLGYLDPVRRGNLKPALPGKITAPVTIPEGLTPAEKANPESIQEALQLQALMDFKKQRALQKVKDAQERAAELHGCSQRLALGHRDVGTTFARLLQDAEADRVERDDCQSPVLMSDFAHCFNLFQTAVEIRSLNHQAGR